MALKVDLLGPVRAASDADGPVEIGGVRLRMLFARLALEGGRPVGADGLVDGLWGEQPPADAANALQALVSRLRKSLRGHATVESVAGGYRLDRWTRPCRGGLTGGGQRADSPVRHAVSPVRRADRADRADSEATGWQG